MGSTNRAPSIEREALALYERTSKATWAELYVDLYRQTHGDERTAAEWIADAVKRSEILESFRRQRSAQSQRVKLADPVLQMLSTPKTHGALALASFPAQAVSVSPVALAEPEPVALHADAFMPSAYQAGIFDFVQYGDGDGIVNAVAGSGKTTTLTEAAKLLHDPALFVAFNKHIADELQLRLAGTPMTARTVHSIGLDCLRKHLGYTSKPDGGKYLKPCWAAAEQIVPRRSAEQAQAQQAIKKLVDYARLTLTDPRDWNAMAALVEHHHVEIDTAIADLIFDAVPDVIEAGMKLARGPQHLIDFTDMLYIINMLPSPPSWRCPVDSARAQSACRSAAGATPSR